MNKIKISFTSCDTNDIIEWCYNNLPIESWELDIDTSLTDYVMEFHDDDSMAMFTVTWGEFVC